jgi:hypothetical protein
MDRAMLERHLAEAEMHITESERHIARQREIVTELENDGRDLKSAQVLHHLVCSYQYDHRVWRERIGSRY